MQSSTKQNYTQTHDQEKNPIARQKTLEIWKENYNENS